ncbi:hypothetical protein ACKAV7_008063 [Fusarium commune]|uniref:Uncharacterized protein n=1 Tax=Fusarium oxysporum f. sp. rapae TaxID=485398 RepID=A0A8J5P2A5_FUSOX|nr:hypothetical protein Forpe1208_v008067 [Fusarium oxysporum f. sp. rapae]KAI7769642.1 hypothetical protein LZL87_003132 [Fusarium oxysporum]
MALPTTDLQEYPQWIHDPELRTPRFDGDPRCHRDIFPQLEQALSLRGGHRPRQWGFAIIRTAYGPKSDEQFQHALTLICRIAQAWSDREIASSKMMLAYAKENNIERLSNISMEVDTRLNDDFTRRYQNDILQDKQQLDGASVATVRRYFNNWIASNNGSSVAGDVRFTTCIMLDAETLLQLAEAPKDLGSTSSEYYSSQYWVKMVEAESGYDEAFRALLYGRYGLAEYLLHRNSSRRLVVHRKNRENPGVLYYGIAPRELTPYEQAMQDAFKAHMQQGPDIGSDQRKD